MGDHVGVSFVENEEELSKALEEVYDIDNEAIIEEVLNGIEISVPIIGGEVYPTLLIEALAGSFLIIHQSMLMVEQKKLFLNLKKNYKMK